MLNHLFQASMPRLAAYGGIASGAVTAVITQDASATVIAAGLGALIAPAGRIALGYLALVAGSRHM